MNLEQRVLVVEQELQVLKTQIQATLLNIQEHLLNSTYPGLRANESRSAVSSMSDSQASATHSNPVKRVAIPEINAASETIDEVKMPPPVYHEETIQASQIARRKEPVQASEVAFDKQRDAGQHYQPADVRLWIELDKWVDQKVKEVGIQRTRELIMLFEGRERELLMQVVDIYDSTPEMVRPTQTMSIPARPQSVVPQTRTVAEEWQKYANGNKARNATYRPFGEHQELALRLLADILNSNETVNSGAVNNGQSRH